jgi:iron(III) transport system ATP-binding protein
MTDINIDALTVSYGESKVLDNLSLHIPSQKLVAVLGPSGCGKSTLLRAIAGFVAPQTGTIRFGSTLMSVSSVQVPPERRNVGYVPQEGALFPHLSVAKNIGFGLAKGKSSQKRIDEMLKLVDMTSYANRLPHQLSGGQQFRVAIARALAPAPNVMLLDEPFSALDAQLREELRQEIKIILKATNTTTLLVTHDREEALVMADLVAPMKDGKIIQIGTPQAVYNFPAGPETAVSTGDALIISAIKTKSGKIYTPLSSIQPQSGVKGKLVVRPEEIQIELVKSKSNAKVAEIEYFGHDALIHLELADKSQICARVAAPVSLKIGDKVLATQTGPIRFYDEN